MIKQSLSTIQRSELSAKTRHVIRFSFDFFKITLAISIICLWMKAQTASPLPVSSISSSSWIKASNCSSILSKALKLYSFEKSFFSMTIPIHEKNFEPGLISNLRKFFAINYISVLYILFFHLELVGRNWGRQRGAFSQVLNRIDARIINFFLRWVRWGWVLCYITGRKWIWRDAVLNNVLLFSPLYPFIFSK